MEKLNFSSAAALRQFYLEHGYFAIYDCTTEIGDLEITHYSLLKSGETISPECLATGIMNLEDDSVLNLLDRFLKTGTVRIHPSIFQI